MSYPTFEQLTQWRNAAAVNETYPLALIEDKLRAAIADPAVVADLMSDLDSLISDREREAREIGDQEGYDRGREDFDCGPFGHD